MYRYMCMYIYIYIYIYLYSLCICIYVHVYIYIYPFWPPFDCFLYDENARCPTWSCTTEPCSFTWTNSWELWHRDRNSQQLFFLVVDLLVDESCQEQLGGYALFLIHFEVIFEICLARHSEFSTSLTGFLVVGHCSWTHCWAPSPQRCHRQGCLERTSKSPLMVRCCWKPMEKLINWQPRVRDKPSSGSISAFVLGFTATLTFDWCSFEVKAILHGRL